MHTRPGFVVLLILGVSTSALAQRRISYTLRPATPILFQAPTSADLARTLTGGTLPSTSIPSVGRPVVDSAVTPVPTCPMPVVTMDSTRVTPMPTMSRDSVSRDRMPVLRPSCANPLRR